MAVVVINSTPQAVTLPPGTPITISAACTFSYTAAGAATGVVITGAAFPFIWTWPGIFVGPYGGVTLFVTTATTANLDYLS